MLPVIAIVGRPNVGKSTLFNQLTRSRNALVVDLPGVTRDRQYGEGKLGDRSFIVIDTGGLQASPSSKEKNIENHMIAQSWQAIKDADLVLFMVDGKTGLTGNDENIAKELRQSDKPIILVVNKTEGMEAIEAGVEFFKMGLGKPIPIAASHGRGIIELIDQILEKCPLQAQGPFPPLQDENMDEEAPHDIKIAIIGRPNVGKSTLVNRILGEDRVIVFDEPGTTRDSIYIPFERAGKSYIIIDTAGVRRRARIKETVEKFSVVKTLQAIEASDVVVLVLDATSGVTDQDLGLLGFILDAGRSLVIALNKWDGLTTLERNKIKQTLAYRLSFADFAKIHFISALQGAGLNKLFFSIQKAYRSSTEKHPTSKLTRILTQAQISHAPPMVKGRRIKLRYAHLGGLNPPRVVIHGNQTEHVPLSYQRYLMNTFRKALHLEGTPIRLEFKTGENPYDKRGQK